MVASGVASTVVSTGVLSRVLSWVVVSTGVLSGVLSGMLGRRGVRKGRRVRKGSVRSRSRRSPTCWSRAASSSRGGHGRDDSRAFVMMVVLLRGCHRCRRHDSRSVAVVLPCLRPCPRPCFTTGTGVSAKR